MVRTTASYEHLMEATTDRYGGTETSTMAEVVEQKFHPVDWVILSLMLVLTMVIGVVSTKKNSGRVTIQDYLLGGSKMSPLPVAISLLGSIVSSITILGNPTEVYFYGTQITTTLLGFFLGAFFVNLVILPTFYNLKMVTLSEYLELRYKSVTLRKLATMVMVLMTTITMGMVLYGPSLALSTVTSLSSITSMVIMGAIVTFYSTIGGMKAVVYTDVLQTLLMIVGFLMVMVLCCIDLGGVGEVWSIAGRGGRLEFFNLDTSPYIRHTFWSTIALGFFQVTYCLGVNQTAYQRFAVISTLKTAKRLTWFFVVGVWCLWIMFFFSGLVAYAVYSTCDPLTSGKINKEDQIIPFLLNDKLIQIPGVCGLFVSAVYSAMLSTLSSMGNSIACMVWEDFLKPLSFFSGLNESSATCVVRSISCIAGVLTVAVGILVSSLGNIFPMFFGISSAIMGPLCGVFLGGILLPWVDVKGAVSGFLVSFSYNMWITVGRFLKKARIPSKLQLSVAGCELSFNDTLEPLISTTLDYTSLHSTTISNTFTIDEEPDTKDVFDISYCYNGLIGITISMLVAGFISLILGPTCLEDVEGGVVNPTCERLYKQAWHMYRSRRNVCSISGVKGKDYDTSNTNLKGREG